MTLRDNYCTISEAAKELGVTRQTISRWIRQGKLSGEKIGREIIIRKSELRASQTQRISYVAADKILDFLSEEITKYCREKGRITEDEYIRVIGDGRVLIPTRDGADRILELSNKDWQEITKRVKPILTEFLFNLTRGMNKLLKRAKIKETTQSNIKGGKKSK